MTDEQLQAALVEHLGKFLTVFGVDDEPAVFLDATVSVVVFVNGSLLMTSPTAGAAWLSPGYELSFGGEPFLLGTRVVEATSRQGLPMRIEPEHPTSLEDARALA